MHQNTAKAAHIHRPKHILVVDDNRDVLDVITEMLLQRGDRISAAIGGGSMRAVLDAGDPVVGRSPELREMTEKTMQS